MKQLGVNIDHIATLRQARGTAYPDPCVAAKLAQAAGADQITLHLREDRRHIQTEDLFAVQRAIQIPLNLEMAATEEMRDIVRELRPEKITLVPEKRQELTTEGGLDVKAHESELKAYLKPLSKLCAISLFIDPEPSQIEASARLGVQAVEFHTGNYADAADPALREVECQRLAQACAAAKRAGFFVAVGHGLNYQNVMPLQKIPEIQEYNIGHSIVAHAVIVGWERAVREMKALVA